MHPMIVLMRFLSIWPLGMLRSLGWVLGHALYGLAASRRQVAQVNLALCFPQRSARERSRMVRRHMVMVMQSLLDRSWLWHGSMAQIQRRLQVVGDDALLKSDQPVVVFAPHFVGLDAGGTALTVLGQVPMSSIYVPQRHPALDAWVREGRNRSGRNKLYFRHDGVKQILSGLRQGDKLYLLPDMDFGPAESIFVPFFNVPAATLPSLSRFAKLGRARVVPVITRMTETGYEVVVHPAWADFPTDDAEADTASMNQRLEVFINTMPDQYFWVHKRFKTRPAGASELY